MLTVATGIGLCVQTKVVPTDETNRYGCEEDRGYYPCRMVACFPLDVIAHGTVEEIVKQMNRADHQDDEEA